MKKQKIKLKSFQALHDKWMKDPEYKKAYDSLEFEFQLKSALIDARAKQKLTQKKLAEKIGVAQPALARFESGRTNPTLSFLQKVASGLGKKMVLK